MWWLFTIVLSVFVFPQTVHAGASGHPRVIDGDTLAFGDLRVRLDGMDAAELDQTCQSDVRILPCGQMARDALVSLIGGAAVDCQATGTDRYGRMLAMCSVQGRDLGRVMVQQGMARVDPRFSQRYLPDQDAAVRAGVGLWSMQHEPPAVARRGTAPVGCTIKGNRSANGAIYHLPGQADYDRTRIDPAKGERWFCSETEARAAGWRPARR